MHFRIPTLLRLFAISALALAMTAGAPVAAFARPRPTPTPTATPSPPPEDKAVTQIARREFVSWQAGVVDIRHYATQTQAKLIPQKIADTSRALGSLGSLIRTKWVAPAVVDGMSNVKGYIYKMVCTNAAVYEILTIAPDGRIDGIVFRDKLPH